MTEMKALHQFNDVAVNKSNGQIDILNLYCILNSKI